jgi:hypothetical protein
MAVKALINAAIDSSRKARMQRAKDQGHSVARGETWYHATTGKEFDRFDPDMVGSRFPKSFGVHMSNSKNEATHYMPPGGTMRELSVSPKNTLVIDIPEGGPFVTASMKADLDRPEIIERLVMAKRAGNPYDSVRIRKKIPDDWQDWTGDSGYNENFIMLDESGIRDVNAQFDPAKRKSSKLLASAMGVGVLGTAALTPQEAEAGPVNIIDPITGLIRKGIEAYHGSPHKFDKFSMDKIGTGEGAQAYGHGLYFADSEDVAKGYRETLSEGPRRAALANRLTLPDEYKYENELFVNQLDQNKGDIGETLSDLRRYANSFKSDGDYQSFNRLDEFAKRVESKYPSGGKLELEDNYGALYRTELDVDPDTLLDWDKPLSEQSEAVQGRLRGMGSARITDLLDNPPKYNKGGDYWEYGGNTYESKAEALSDFSAEDIMHSDRAGIGRTPQEISTLLKDNGIPGIRYKDGMSRGADGGTSNYVMFDDSKISIKERGMATPAALAVTAGVTGTGLALSDSPDYLDTLASQVNRGPEGSLYDTPQEFAAQQPYETPTEVAPQRSMMDQITSSPYAAALGDAASVAGQGASFAFDALELPMRYGHGLAAALGVLAEGGTWDNALLRGSKVGKQSLDVTGKQLGEYVARKTGNPYAAALTDALTNVTSPL